MPRFAANLTLLFQELPYADRFDVAAEAGFEAVEILFPYEEPARDTARALLRNGLELVLINAPPPNYAGGAPGFAAVPGGEARFRQDFRRALRYVEALRAKRLHIMAGAAEGTEARAAFEANLRWAAQQAPDLALTIEPINTTDMPGYFLNDFALALDILDAVAAPNLSLQFDAYHAHRITGDVMRTYADCAGRIGHVQIADAPGRHEPGSGEIDFPTFFERLDSDGYTGWVSAEYRPQRGTAEGLDWLPKGTGT
jgi:hydroxypyruvate isomerase